MRYDWYPLLVALYTTDGGGGQKLVFSVHLGVYCILNDDVGMIYIQICIYQISLLRGNSNQVLGPWASKGRCTELECPMFIE
jgi:hypothetical protein